MLTVTAARLSADSLPCPRTGFSLILDNLRNIKNMSSVAPAACSVLGTEVSVMAPSCVTGTIRPLHISSKPVFDDLWVVIGQESLGEVL
jgi:hypothetical protein